MKRFLIAVLMLPATLSAQETLRVTPVEEVIATEFAANGMGNAVSKLLVYPSLARRIFTHDRYITTESTLPPRHRALLALRTAWLTRSNYLWAHRAILARKAGLTDADLRSRARCHQHVHHGQVHADAAVA